MTDVVGGAEVREGSMHDLACKGNSKLNLEHARLVLRLKQQFCSRVVGRYVNNKRELQHGRELSVQSTNTSRTYRVNDRRKPVRKVNDVIVRVQTVYPVNFVQAVRQRERKRDNSPVES